jgi:hypothetical protein
VVKRENKDGSVIWRCSVRNNKTSCPAAVRQLGESFIPCDKVHVHASKPGVLSAIRIQKKVVDLVKKELFVPAPTIVEQVLEEYADHREPEFSRPKFTNIVRTANRKRQADRPEEPKDINFEV